MDRRESVARTFDKFKLIAVCVLDEMPLTPCGPPNESEILRHRFEDESTLCDAEEDGIRNLGKFGMFSSSSYG